MFVIYCYFVFVYVDVWLWSREEKNVVMKERIVKEEYHMYALGWTQTHVYGNLVQSVSHYVIRAILERLSCHDEYEYE